MKDDNQLIEDVSAILKAKSRPDDKLGSYKLEDTLAHIMYELHRKGWVGLGSMNDLMDRLDKTGRFKFRHKYGEGVDIVLSTFVSFKD